MKKILKSLDTQIWKHNKNLTLLLTEFGLTSWKNGPFGPESAEASIYQKYNF